MQGLISLNKNILSQIIGIIFIMDETQAGSEYQGLIALNQQLIDITFPCKNFYNNVTIGHGLA